jgi:hypothetical protein
MTPERERWFTKVENQLQRGELAVPFCWRPKHLLLNVTDVVHLWYIGKHAAKDARAYHLTMATEPNYEELDLSRGLDRPPLIDLTSLLVVYDLHLLAVLFRVFPKIAIPKRTLMEIQTLAHPFPWGYTPLVEIRDLLKTHMAQISHSTEFSGGALRYSQYTCHFNTLPPPCFIHTHYRRQGDETWHRPPR